MNTKATIHFADGTFAKGTIEAMELNFNGKKSHVYLSVEETTLSLLYHNSMNAIVNYDDKTLRIDSLNSSMSKHNMNTLQTLCLVKLNVSFAKRQRMFRYNTEQGSVKYFSSDNWPEMTRFETMSVEQVS